MATLIGIWFILGGALFLASIISVKVSARVERMCDDALGLWFAVSIAGVFVLIGILVLGVA